MSYGTLLYVQLLILLNLDISNFISIKLLKIIKMENTREIEK